MNVFHTIDDLIGSTPLLAVDRLASAHGAQATVLVKLERFNPGGSIKDRAALGMLDEAEQTGQLRRGEGYTIIEPTSGNTGVGLASMGAARGYRVVIVMPDSMSAERRALMAAYGAELVLTPGAKGMSGAVERARELLAETPRSWMAGQFDNAANARAHERTTGPEIWRDTDGAIDILVAGVGTGGTITGCGRHLKGRKPEVEVVAVEPASSPLLSGGTAAPHGIQGIGANFIPEVLDRTVVDRVLPVCDEDARRTARELARTEGVLAGISSGAALWAALELACEPRNAGKTIVAVLPDTGERYLSTGVFDA